MEVFLEETEVAPKIAKITDAPRRTGKDKTFGYEYRNATALSKTLKDGETTIDVQYTFPKNKKGEVSKIPKFTSSVSYSDGAKGACWLGFKTTNAEHRTDYGKNELVYPCISLPPAWKAQNPSVFAKKTAENEIKQEFDVIYQTMGMHLEQIAKQLFPNHSFSMIIPKGEIRIDLPRSSTKTVFKQVEDESGNIIVKEEKVSTDFDIHSYLSSMGRPMVKMQAPFFIVDDSNKMINAGFKWAFSQKKYLSDAETAMEKERKDRIKAKEDAALAAEFNVKPSKKRPRVEQTKSAGSAEASPDALMEDIPDGEDDDDEEEA